MSRSMKMKEMNKEENTKELARDVFKAMNARDFELFDRVITDDVAFDFPGVGKISFISEYFKDTSFAGNG